MYCMSCGQSMELLPDLYFNTGKSWYGCKNCNTVVEDNYCSVTGRQVGINPCKFSYQEYMERVNKKMLKNK